MAELALFRHGEELLRVALAGRTVVGRGASCDVSLPDPTLSRAHAAFELRGDSWVLVDLTGRGARVGRGLVREAALADGAELALGSYRALFRAAPDTSDDATRVGGDATLLVETRAEIRPSLPGAFEGMISSAPALRQVFELVERVAPSMAPVTILGETGTGKELVARALHRLSGRQGAFVPVNCSAIAETLIESELFGHERGAFSGAERQRKGAFEEAHGGTLFLDEIGELPLDLQPKLLRALEQGEVKRVGASRPIEVEVRILAATHRDLRARVRAGRFREDLYYRLCVVPVTVPPLRARKGDVRALASHFLQRAVPKGQAVRFSEAALARLEGHDWPGNVRQLRNAVQRALLFRGEGLVIGPDAIVFDDARDPGPPAGGDDDVLYVRGLTMEAIEREAIRLSLRRHAGRRAAVVKELSLAKSTVMKRIGQWGLHAEGRGADRAAEGPEEDDEG